MKPTIIVRGNAQAEALYSTLSGIPSVNEAFEVLYDNPQRSIECAPNDEQLQRCRAFFEQRSEAGIADQSRLGPQCVHVTFPLLSLNLLWPFTCVNSYAAPEPPEFPEGRYPYGNAIVVEYLNRGLGKDVILAALLTTGWERHWPDLGDALAIETGRLASLDSTCDVQMGEYVLDNFHRERLFWAVNLPSNALLAELLARLLQAAFGEELALSRDRIFAYMREWGDRDLLAVTSVPVHPHVANHFALQWYDPNDRYWLLDKSIVTYAEYFESMIDASIVVRQAREERSAATRKRRIAIVFGNCQADALSLTLSKVADQIKGLHVLYLPSYEKPGGWTPLSEDDVAKCDVLFEQHDPQQFPLQHLLPSSCQRVKFPSLDFNLLWPLGCVNPYNRPEPPNFPQGRYTYGNYLVVHGIEVGRPREDILQSLLSDSWEDSWPNLDRLLAIERARLSARDAQCAVKMAPVILDGFRDRRLFWTVNHPTNALFAELCTRLLATAFDPAEVENVSVDAVLAGIGTKDLLGIVGVPIHPHVAQHFGLAWYSRDDRLPFYDEAPKTYEEYFTQMLDASLAAAADGAPPA